MRVLTISEQEYINSYLKRQRVTKRITGLFMLLITTLYIKSALPSLLESIDLTSIYITALVMLPTTVMAIFLLVGSTKYFSKGSVIKISGIYNQRQRKRVVQHYIGKTKIQVPRAFLNSLELKNYYTLELFSGKSGIIGFSPVVLNIEGLTIKIKETPSDRNLERDRATIKILFYKLFPIIMAFIIPLLFILLFFQYGAKTQFITNLFNNHKEETQSVIEYLSTNDSLFNLIQFLFKNLFIIIIVLSIVIFIIFKIINSIISSKNINETNYSNSHKEWLNEYEKFMINEFRPEMQQAMGKNRTVTVNYQDVMIRHNKFKQEFNMLKKSISKDEKKELLAQLRIINRRI